MIFCQKNDVKVQKICYSALVKLWRNGWMLNEIEYKNKIGTWNGFAKLITYSSLITVVILALMAVTLL